jgi:hypothetical protein
MDLNYKRWQKLFLFCSGLALGAAFCMKWMETDLWQGGEKFTVIGLEITYSADKLNSIMMGLSEQVRTILRYHLHFDYAFMAGVYPGIAALCMMAREKTVNESWKKLLFIIALLQTLAWACDIFENRYLLKWMSSPVTWDAYQVYHVIVWTKWIIALSAIIIVIPFFVRRKRK